MVPSLYCVYRVPGYGTVFVFSLFLFTGVVQPTQVLLYWSRNNKIENRIFCPQESTIAISRCLHLLPAVQSPCCAVYVPDQQCCVFAFAFGHTVFSSFKTIFCKSCDHRTKSRPSHCHRLLNGCLQYGPHQPGGKSRSTLADLILSLH